MFDVICYNSTLYAVSGKQTVVPAPDHLESRDENSKTVLLVLYMFHLLW